LLTVTQKKNVKEMNNLLQIISARRNPYLRLLLASSKNLLFLNRQNSSETFQNSNILSSSSSNTTATTTSTTSSTISTSIDFPGVSASANGLSSQPPQLMLAVYTCKVCETRSARRITKAAYERGSVLLCCPGCKKLHVLSDHLGYFDDATVDAAKILEERGEIVRRVTSSDALLELLTEDDINVFKSITKGISLKDGTEKAVVAMSDSDKR
jgi:protein import protein ZIM17